MSATQTILFGIRFVCRDRVPCVLATVVGRFLCGGRVYLTVCVLRYCGGRSAAKVFALRAGNSNRAANAELNWLVWYAGGGGWWYGLAEALRWRLKTQGVRVLVAVAVLMMARYFYFYSYGLCYMWEDMLVAVGLAMKSATYTRCRADRTRNKE